MEGLTFSYQWLRDGQPIEGATAKTYTVANADRGTNLTVRVTAAAEGRPSGVADSAPVFVKFGSSAKVTVSPYIGKASQTFAVTVAVDADRRRGRDRRRVAVGQRQEVLGHARGRCGDDHPAEAVDRA